MKSLTALRDEDISHPYTCFTRRGRLAPYKGVINVLVYEAPEELAINKVCIKKLRFIFFAYIATKV